MVRFSLVPDARAIRRARLAPLWLVEFARAAVSGKRPSYAATSLELTRNAAVKVLLGARPVFWSRLLPTRPNTLLGWGRQFSGRRVAAVQDGDIQPLILEDGFLRSTRRRDFPMSFVLDDRGIYYDAQSQSRLFRLIPESLSDAEAARARNIMARWRILGLTKYNDAPDPDIPLDTDFVLVIDQVRGDLSIRYGQADEVSFQTMLDTALRENPGMEVFVKIHPDSRSDPRKRHFSITELSRNPRIRVIAQHCHVPTLIKASKRVYVVTSQVGFEGLLHGKPVHTFGMPFYAGWGLTTDALPKPDGRGKASLEQLTHAALVAYPRYIDPVAMQVCDAEYAIAHIGLQRRKRHELPPQVVAIGFSRWKRPFIKSFLQGSEVTFAKSAKLDRQLAKTHAVAVWGSAPVPAGFEDAQVLRIEDGFLRSSGLGAELVRPLSLVVDDIGIYYDATQPSRLERILDTQTFDKDQLNRAAELRRRLIQLDVTKYNLGAETWERPGTRDRVLLVVGQVETDASIRLGSPEIKTNIGLLRRVRQENPDAYIVYKPHPDVLAGLRKHGEGEDASVEVADEVLTSRVSIGCLLSRVDEVHTMTSLMGFEALIRGMRVVCHGLPFYAGWGLTEDRLPCARRSKQLSVDAVVYGALISYPRYFHYEGNCFIEPERAVEHLAIWSTNGPTARNWRRRVLRAAIAIWLKLKGSTR